MGREETAWKKCGGNGKGEEEREGKRKGRDERE